MCTGKCEVTHSAVWSIGKAGVPSGSDTSEIQYSTSDCWSGRRETTVVGVTGGKQQLLDSQEGNYSCWSGRRETTVVGVAVGKLQLLEWQEGDYSCWSSRRETTVVGVAVGKLQLLE